MNKMLILSIMLMTSLSTYADFNSTEFGERILEQVGRQSSCTYKLTIIRIYDKIVEPISISANSQKEACVLARIECHKIGKKEGLFGVHKCDLMAESDGGIVTRTVEGDYPDSRVEIKRLKRINAKQRSEIEYLKKLCN